MSAEELSKVEPAPANACALLHGLLASADRVQVLPQALENAKANDLLFWASRYNLFVLWSADRTHPWDSLPGAASYVTLEIGKQRGSDSEVRCRPWHCTNTEHNHTACVDAETLLAAWMPPYIVLSGEQWNQEEKCQALEAAWL